MSISNDRGAKREINVVSGADDNFAMPLAATVRSALDCLGRENRMRLFVLDGGLTADSKARLRESWNDPRLTIEWLRADHETYRDLPVSHHISSATYLRLLMPTLLPRDVERVIYLDADMLVRRDLGELWDVPQAGYAVLAVQDLVAPYFDSTHLLPNFDRWRRHMTTATPIFNYRELGLSPECKYFNGGMLVVDLAEWRRRQYVEQMLACLRDNREHVLWWDQYALNVVLAGKWGQLDHRWNQGAHLYVYPEWRDAPLDEATYRRLARDPWIVHFCSPSKPWQCFCPHPFTRAWRRTLRRTAWRGWQPERPERYLHKLWDFHYKPLRAQWKSRTRALKAAVGYYRRRDAA